MGCFLGCFGLSSKRKRGKQADRVLPGGQVRRLCNYEPLKSASAHLDFPGEDPLVGSVPEVSLHVDSRKTKETLNSKIKKKVSFNLNVKTYEPIPREESTDNFCENDEEANEQKICKRNSEECISSSVSQADPIAEKMASYPPNHRYWNCIDSYEEEDEIAYSESDLDDEDEDDIEGEIDDLGIRGEEYSEQFNSFSVNPQKGASLTQIADHETNNYSTVSSSNGASVPLGLNRHAQDRRLYAHSVLKPVENVTQWKAAKARGITPPIKQQIEKEPEKPFSSVTSFGQSKTPVLHDIAVDASLSNWLAFSNSNQPKSTTLAKGSSFDTSSLMNREDMPVLDITNLDSW